MRDHRPLAAVRPFAAVALASLLPDTPAAARWEAASFPGEGRRTVQGCALKHTDDTYVCVFVRCDGPGRLGLHATAPGPDIRGAVTFRVDGKPFPLAFPRDRASPVPLSNRADAIPAGLLAAMKTGTQLRIVGAGLGPGYDVIPLGNAGPAIARIEAACGAGTR